jgi:hypothetical protein
VIEPATAARNLTPSSTALVSAADATAGVADSGQMVQGQLSDGGVVVVKLAGAAGAVDELPAPSADVTV